MTWHTMDTMPERGEQVLLWRGLTDDDGGFPAIARAVFYKGDILIRYKPDGEDWQELTRDEYPSTMWARIPKPGDEDEHNERDCRDCVEWETCPVGKGAHERGASIGYSAGECPDFRRADDDRPTYRERGHRGENRSLETA